MEDGSGPELYNAICALDDSSWESRIGRRFPDFPLARIIRFPRKKVERKAKGKSPFNVSRLVAASNYNPKIISTVDFTRLISRLLISSRDF